MAEPLKENTLFSYDEAAAMLPEVRLVTDEAYREVEALSASPDKDAEERLNDVVGRWVAAMLSRGLEVKGLWLVDFDNGNGYYCWRYPETGLMFYQSYDEGFGGRMRIQ